MHARFYDPDMGRFLSVDPSQKRKPRQPQSWNRYAYSLNNPLKYVDPDGRDAVVFIVSPGSGMDERAGHAAVWVESGTRGTGVSRGGRDIGQRGWKDFLSHYTGEGRTVHAYILKTTDAQDQAMIKFVDQNPGGGVNSEKSIQTCGLSENCSSAVANVLQAGGVVAPGTDLTSYGPLDTPNELKYQLDHGVLAGNVDRHIDFTPPVRDPERGFWGRLWDRITN
ncbi:MAG: RHS repeat-associated core domain-containing protein, partial [Acidobacteriota bacterium]